ncbi:MAG TPA: tetratricopeptide repeat protein [Steroidobacteraceae bacterium]|nr:tetratricopeptide repeat protein [Steroidobacteraceae bacterium]
MRILIADDSTSLPASVQDIFGRAPVGASAGKTPSVESVVIALGGSVAPAAAAAPAKSMGRDTGSSDSCPPSEPLPPCPPCSLHDQPELLATILDAIGMALLNRGCIEAGSKFVVAALEIRLAHFGKKHPYTAASYNSNARVLRIRGELIEAEKEVGKAIVINRKVYGSSGLPLAANLNELGAARLYQGDFKGALKAAESGLAILRKRGVYNEDPNTSRLLDVKGRALEGLGKLAAAASALSQALKLDEKQVGADHPKYATHRANLATVQELQKNLSAAREGYEHAVRVYDTVLGRTGHPNLIDTYANLGSLLVKIGDFATAKDHLCKALGLNEQLRGADHTLVGNDHANLGRYYFASGNKQAAADEFRKALEIYKQNVKRRRLPKNHPYIEEAQTWLKRTGC